MIENNINGENKNYCQIFKISNDEHKKIFKEIEIEDINKELKGSILKHVETSKNIMIKKRYLYEH